jgi:transposase
MHWNLHVVWISPKVFLDPARPRGNLRQNSLMFMPSYSPDLSLIEMGFAKLKALRRAKAIRMVEVFGTHSEPS